MDAGHIGSLPQDLEEVAIQMSRKIKLYNELNSLLKNKIPIRYLWDNGLNDKYVLKKTSVIMLLYERYGTNFSEETAETWRDRWIQSRRILKPVNVDPFKPENNKHLILTILNIAAPYMKVERLDQYIRWKWGLKSYHSDISRYIKNGYDHSETKAIKLIIEYD